METTIAMLYRGYIGLYRGYIERMEKNMETTIMRYTECLQGFY